MSYPKMALLVRKLLEKSRQGKIAWEQSPKAGVYQASFPEFTVQIGTRGREDETDVVLRIFNSGGQLVEEIADPELRGDIEKSFGVMMEIYETARRTAMGVEQALDKLLSELASKDDQVPF
jgi:hypothetical protein